MGGGGGWGRSSHWQVESLTGAMTDRPRSARHSTASSACLEIDGQRDVWMIACHGRGRQKGEGSGA